jgi:hypothetical protein
LVVLNLLERERLPLPQWRPISSSPSSSCTILGAILGTIVGAILGASVGAILGTIVGAGLGTGLCCTVARVRVFVVRVVVVRVFIVRVVVVRVVVVRVFVVRIFVSRIFVRAICTGYGRRTGLATRACVLRRRNGAGRRPAHNYTAVPAFRDARRAAARS